MARQRSFGQTKALGSLGEQFVYAHFHELTNADLILNNTMTADKNIAGEDTTAYIAKFGAPDPNWLPDYVTGLGKGTLYPIVEARSGSHEAKTINSFMWRTNDNEDPSGTIGFELWEDASRKSYGWTAKIFNSERFDNARRPLSLTILLVAYGSPFASIHFSDINELHERLRQLFHEDDLDNDGYHFDTYPAGKKAASWQQDNPAISDNMWLISLSRIEDLAVVTMIGDMPRIRLDIEAGKRKCSKKTQLKRYDHLVNLSGGRSITQDEAYRYRFCIDKSEEVFLNLDYNLSLIENQFWKDYPVIEKATRKTSLFTTLRLVLMNMLTHEYPAYPSYMPIYFQIGREYFKKWIIDNKFGTGNLTTINGHIRILAVSGLIKQYFPYDSNPDPILQQLNRNHQYGKNATLYTVEKYTPQLIESAGKILEKLNNAHMLNGHITEQDLIRLFDRKFANKFFSDNRDTSKEEKHVEKMIQDSIKQAVRKNGYAIPAEVYRQVGVEVDEIVNAPKIDETSRMRYLRAYRKMEKRLSSLAEDIECTARRIRNEDRDKLGIPKEIQGNMITKR